MRGPARLECARILPPTPAARIGSPNLRLAKENDDVHRFAVAHHGETDLLARPVFLDFGQEFFDRADTRVIDGNDQVGRLGIEGSPDEPRGDPFDLHANRPHARAFGSAPFDNRHHQ